MRKLINGKNAVCLYEGKYKDVTYCFFTKLSLFSQFSIPCSVFSASTMSRRFIHGLFAFLSYDKIIDVSFCYAANAA